MRSGHLVAIALLLAAGVFAADPRAESHGGETVDEPEDLSARVARLESELTESVREESIRRGAKTFARVCAACHGGDGSAQGHVAAGFRPRPRNLTVNHYRYRSTRTGAPPRPEDIERTIRDGLPGTSMTGLGDLLSEEEIKDVISFVYSLEPRTAEMDQPPEALAVPALLPEDPARSGDGRAMYVLMGCWTCHGMKGGGKGYAAKALKSTDERPIRTTDFRYEPLKAGRDPEAIVRSLLTGLNGAPTPAYEDRAILVTSDFVVEDINLQNQLTDPDRENIERFLEQSPSPDGLAAMSEGERKSLRDRRLYDLAYYLLSLDRRHGAGYWLFRQRPELEARKP